MIWRSVVGKLWITIILLVAVTLLVLSLLLGQFFDRYYEGKQSESLVGLAKRLSNILAEYPDSVQAMHMASEIVEAYDTRMIVIDVQEGQFNTIAITPNTPNVDLDQLFDHEELVDVFYGAPQLVERGSFQYVDPNDKRVDVDILAVAVPLTTENRKSGAIILYQSLSQLNETTTEAKRLILYAAFTGIMLATIFAFFLSSRVTKPLIQMKKASDRMIKGEFNTKVDIRTNDEIGDLAFSFNRMAAQLDDSINALSREKEQLASILRSMVDGVITIGIDRKIILTNPHAEQWMHMWRKEIGVGSKSRQLDSLPSDLITIYEVVVTDENEHSGDVTVHGRTWSVVMAPLYAKEQLRGVVAVLRDVTEQRRLDRLRKDFVANVSHELRTPIAMLQGYSEAIVDDVAGTPEEQKEIAQIILDESQRMGRLVSELLDLARMEARHIRLYRTEIDMTLLIEKVARKFSGLLKERQVQLHMDVAEDMSSMMIDEDKIEQVFTNLIENAIRHTPVDGSIILRAEELLTKGLHISVQDTGSGIPEEDVPFIFERFYKADKARTRGESGTGLGLAIVKNIVEAHEGTIGVQSEIGKGTIFSIFLPYV
ncbi:MAG: ATP-binding protein [Bacilli bacterium]